MLTLELEPEVERRAMERAAARGQSLPEYVVALITREAGGSTSGNGSSCVLNSAQGLERRSESTNGEKAAPTNMLEFLGDFVGCVDSTEETTLSERTGEAFTDYLEQKHAAGHL